MAIVGIGASAGGLDALRRLLARLPVDTGAAFVVVQHLSPGRESALAEILGRETTMSVTEVADDQDLAPDHVYVSAPGRDLALEGDRLRSSPQDPAHRHHPIDGFFRSLAESRRALSIGVVLSGTATDGTLGLEEIKAQGGLTFAQDDSAQYGGMPRSAEASGCVDLVLPPEGIADEIARIATHEAFSGALARLASESGSEGERRKQLLPVLRLLRKRKGVDFEDFKTSTLFRRVRRRMLLARRGDLLAYERLLRDDAAELEALHQDILIGVTSFFRDPETWEALRNAVIPLRVRGEGPLRAWVLGCSTGEEAYSLAMLLAEAIDAAEVVRTVQIFATDLNGSAIEKARAGFYSAERLHDVSPERLRRFFVETDSGFRVDKRLRDMCIFARHDLRVDPPFSHIDLVTCRNVLIYLAPSFQEHVVSALHYALEPGGVLVLGMSESLGTLTGRFDTLDARLKVFRRKQDELPGRLPLHPARRNPHAGSEPRSPQAAAGRGVAKGDVQRIAERHLAGFAPPAVLVGGDLEIQQFWGTTEPYLVPAQGRASLGLLRMAREGLGVPLRTSLSRARKEGVAVREEGVQIVSGESLRTIDLEVIPVRDDAATDACFLVLFHERDPAAAALPARAVAAHPGEDDADSAFRRLEHELSLSREHVKVLLQENEAASEELQAVSEEAQSANEEYQSINEELETSKEEIQSTNEELSSVNDQLNARNHELSALNADLANLIASVQIAFVMVGRALQIRHVSPMCDKVAGILGGDVGRPIGEVARGLGLELGGMVADVVETVTPAEFEVQGRDRRWYLLRVRPYLGPEGKVDGAVLVFVDVHEIRRARNDREFVVESLRQPVAVLDDRLRVRSANRAFCGLIGATLESVQQRQLSLLGRGEWNQPPLLRALERVLDDGRPLHDFELEYESELAGHRVLVLNAQRLDLPGEPEATLLLSIEDVSERAALEVELRRRNTQLEEADQAKDRFLAKLAHELRSPLSAILGWTQIMQHPSATAADVRSGIEVIERSSRSQARLIEDLLEMHRLGADRIRLDLVPVALGSVVGEVVADVTPLARARDIDLQYDLHALPLVVRGDAVRLRQILANLLGNALKFTPAGGRISVQLERKGERAELSVRDTGRGMGSQELARLFTDPTSREIAAGDPGLGLGLVISQRLAELHGGELSASSPGEGAGSTFTLSLPIAGFDAPGVPAPVHTRRVPTGLGGRVVLVVDGDAGARLPLQRILEDAGATVVAVSSVDEALSSLERRRPDVVVSELRLPGRDGDKLLRALRPERGGRVPALALTEQASPDGRARCLAAGFDAHLDKPVDAVEVVGAIRELLPAERTAGAE